MKQKLGDDGQFENMLLKNMVLPASHDAGMSELHHMDYQILLRRLSKHRKLGLQNNFYMAVVFSIYEWILIMDQSVWFLNEYKDETFVFKFSHIRDYQEHISKDTIAILHDFLGNYKDYFLKSDTEIEIHELSYNKLKGKILIVCDYDDKISHADGYFRYVDISGMSNIEYGKYKVYDKYSNTSIYE